MMPFETYQHNLDFKDNFGIASVNIDRSVNYRGNINLINKNCENDASETKFPPLGAAVVGLNNTDVPLPKDTRFYDAWSDIDAQDVFLSSKPTCFLILGKPGVGAYTLGEALAKKLSCIHICPRNVIMDEIDQRSSTGRCMDFNLQHNKVCKYDTIISIIKEKLQSPAVQHRGYVMSGMPLVNTRWDERYFIESLNGEESVSEIDELLFDVLVSLKKKKKKKKDDDTATSISSKTEAEGEKEEEEEEVEEEQEPEEEGEEEEPPVELPKYLLEPCTNMITREKVYMTTKKVVLLEQFKQIMNLSMKPDIIIYITCPDADAVSKKTHTYLNNVNASTVFEAFPTRLSSDLRWPIKCDMNIDYVSRQETFNPKYNCRQPMNFKENSTQQLCNFRNHLLPFIEKELEKLEPTTVIKLDGRITLYQMLKQISERLLLLPVKEVCIPEPMYLEEPSDDMEEFWQTVEGLSVIRNDNVSFNRYASPWFNRCPVELKKRLSKKGNPRFAVSFLKHVYLMATLPSMVQFCRNPRPFLKIAYLMPTCRAVIMGTKSSGKTMISKCLEWLFDATYIDYNSFYEQERAKKIETTEKNVLSEISGTIDDTRYVMWQAAESGRTKSLNDWYDATIKKLKQYLPLLVKYLELKCYCVEEKCDEDEQKPAIDQDFLHKFQKSRNELLSLPIVNDVEEIRHAMADRDTLIRLAPEDLVTPIARPATPVLGDSDVTDAINAYIIKNELQKDLEPTPDQLMSEMFQILEEIDRKTAHDTDNEEQYGKWVIDGFPTDPEVWKLVSSSIHMPDYTIALIENREIDSDLFKQYQIIQKSVKNYEERFFFAKDPLIKTKLLKKKPSDSKPLEVKILLHEHEGKVLDTIFNVDNQDSEAANLAAELTAFTEAVEKFKAEWPDVQTKIEEAQKCHIVMELENKTDVAITEEMLLKLRQSYCVPCVPGEEPEEPEDIQEDEDMPRDILTFNLPHFLCETGVYCPIAYYDYGVLWEGKPEFSIKYNNRLHLFSNENNLNELFCKDVTKYQSYSKPFKHIPCLRICVMGCIGSGKTTISKFIAKELGLIHVDFVELINDYLMPKHFKKIGRKYENSFTDPPIDEENAMEIQMGEENLANLEADLLSNETECRRMLLNYFEQGTPLMSVLMQKLLKRIWFQKPFSATGFVLDGFPRMLSDVEDMVACFCIPDLIVDLSSNSDIVLERTGSQMFKTWKAQQTKAKYLAKTKFESERSKWFSFITQKVVIKLLLEDILKQAIGRDEPVKNSSTESYKNDADVVPEIPEPDLPAVYNEFVQEFPGPVDSSTWENASDARERIDTRIEGIYETDDGNIEGLREFASEQKIKMIEIGNTRSLNKTLRMVSAKLATVRNRSGSLLEQTFILDPDVAESLLKEGFYFFSKFNRICPVHVFENPDCIFNPYKVKKSKGMIYTVAHRSYIYFIGGETNLEKFRFDPLKYIANSNINHFKHYPLKFSVIGPPKSGKSTLALKLAKKYGLICISKGKALRHVLDNMHWTELAKQMMVPLLEGNCIETDLIIKSVQTVASDCRTITNGCVFDGFPDSASEAMELFNIGIYPLIIFDLSSDKNTILENSQNETFLDIVKYKPPYSRTFVEDRYAVWSRKCTNIRDWVENEMQNLYVLNGNESRWQCLQDATLRIKSTCQGVYHYLNNVHSNAVPVGVMCVSNAGFQQKMSVYKNLCPVCLSKNVLRHSEFPVDRKGIIQFKRLYYWACPEHMNLVLNNPEHYLATKKVEIPEIPTVVKTVNPSLVYENGICIVSYAENLPAQKIERGTSEFAASYQGNTYLFCAAECLKKFLAKPQLYYNVVVFKDAKLFPELSLKKLPHIGYLEQTLGDMITEACCSVNVLRPKYPGLDIQLSGLLYIALYLKTHNVLTNKLFLPKYKKALITYEARSRRVPVPDERYDFLCEYHKPVSKVPAFLNVVDIAGLVKGAAEGQGLGNAFLSHIKACDAIFNLCRAFDDEDVIHVDGEVNPVRDLETIAEELRLKDEEQLLSALEKLERVVNRGGDKKLKPEYDALLRIKAVLVDEKKHIRFGDWSAADIEVLNRYLFITSKPALYLVNLSEKDYIRKKNKWLPKLKEWIDKNDPGAPLVPFSGVLETKLMDMDPEERKAYLKEHNITSALDKIIVQGYKALQLEYFFTAGPDEVKAWIIQKGTKAPQAAGRIHTDFEKGFIMAEVMHFKDFKEEGSEAACKGAGKYRQQGRNYVVEDGDIIFFKFNAGAGLKDAKKK